EEVLSLIFEADRSDSLNANLNRAARASAQIRDRLSSDVLRVVSQFGSAARTVDGVVWGYVSTGDALAVLNRCIIMLAGLRGFEVGNITRGPGWHFLSMGRRMERAIRLIDIFRAIVVPLSAETWPTLEMLLEVADSTITYRSRYFTALQAAPVLDLIMNDDTNPRSLAFQVNSLIGHCAGLAKMPSGTGWPAAKQRQVEAAAARLFGADVQALCEVDPNFATAKKIVIDDEEVDPPLRPNLDALLADLGAALPNLSEAIANTYFSHALMERVMERSMEPLEGAW
ncbi:MAG TPA: alpha-E domain-containing protein, partial [Acidisarcina sp.]